MGDDNELETKYGLDHEEIKAIAEHEHVSEDTAETLAKYLMHKPHGAERIRDMIVDDIRTARLSGDFRHAKELFDALQDFLADHPEVPPRKP